MSLRSASDVEPRNYFLSPVPSLKLSNQLNHSGVVFKCPIKWGYDDGLSSKARKGAQIEKIVVGESIANEKRILHNFQRRPHSNILQALLIVDESIFLPRMNSTLDDRTMNYLLLHYPESCASDGLRHNYE